MAEESTQAAGENTPNEGEQSQTAAAAPSGEKGERTFTQSEVNELVKKRLDKERGKYADYDDLKAAADARADYDAVVAERDALKAEAERSRLVGKVATEAGVPVALAQMLSGKTEEELAAQAAELAKALRGSAKPSQPPVVSPARCPNFLSTKNSTDALWRSGNRCVMM